MRELLNPDELLVKACKLGNTLMAIDAINNGADINYGNGKPILIATMTGDINMTNLLITNGADVRVQDDVCLTFAAKNNNLQLMDILIDVGAKPNEQTLFEASKRYYPGAIKKCLDNGVNVKKTKDLLSEAKRQDAIDKIIDVENNN